MRERPYLKRNVYTQGGVSNFFYSIYILFLCLLLKEALENFITCNEYVLTPVRFYTHDKWSNYRSK